MAKSNFFTFDSDEEAKFALRQEGKRLKNLANKLWDEYIGSYQPNTYVRTGKSKKSIKLGRVKRLDAFTWGIELMFVDDLAYHDSVMKGGKKGHSIMLISEGWAVSKGNHWGVYRFGYFEGTNYISKLKEAFQQGARQGISIEMNWNGSEFKKQKVQPNVLKR